MVTREDVTSPFAWPAGFWVRANLVANNSGATAGPSGTSSDLTNREDRELLRLIRQDCDALIVGAASIRAEGWHLPPHGQTHVVSRGSTLPWDSCPDASRVTEWQGQDDEPLPMLLTRVVAHLATTGSTSILCEGGLATIRALAEVNRLDELCLTVTGAARADVERALRGILPDPTGWSLASLRHSDDESTIFSVWRCVTGVHS
jgi:riboflavin biosynthesis pyrimidine reductase